MIWTKVLRDFVGLKALLLAGAVMVAAPASASELKVFAAASLTDALDAALKVCSAATNLNAVGIYAGSGTIARQIDQGAPADIYISANPQWMDWLEKRERIADDTRLDLLGNTLVLVGADNAENGVPTLTDIKDSPTKYRIAIGEPTSVPVGIYAKQALESRGWWNDLGNFVQTSSVREVMTWVIRGEVELGVVYATDAKADLRVSTVLEFDPEEHDPIRYPAAVTTDRDTPNARRLLACLTGEEASDILEDFGFTLLNR